MRKSPEILDKYDYSYPPELVAQEPAKPRDSARLLVYDRTTGAIQSDTFRNLADHLPVRAVVVLNTTKVIPARLWCTKPTGGKVQVFYIAHRGGLVYALSDSTLQTGAVLTIARGLTLKVMGKEGSQYQLKPSFPVLRLMAILDRYGTTPIPPYIKHSPLSERRLRNEYQSTFARAAGSVAAPTASLHFTSGLLAKLKAAGHDVRFITLHVGLGTFAPLTAEQLSSGQLHQERYSVDAAAARALNAAKRSGRPIVAVGTTVARTLESASDARGRIRSGNGHTQLFIREGYHFRFVDGLVTNFHVPKSSLMMLVASFVGRTRLLALYRRAIRERFRLFSFGDGMLVR